MRSYFLSFVLLILLGCDTLSSQSVGINEDGSSPHSSAILDVNSTDKGILIPRLDETEINNIINPSEGLMVYNETAQKFTFFDGLEWKDISEMGPLEVVDDVLRLIEGTNSTDLLLGRDEIPSNGQNITDNFMMFDNSKAAMRVGRLAISPNWSPDSLGNYSFASGHNVKAKGIASFATGVNSEATGNYSFVNGSDTHAPSAYEVAMGRYNTLYNPESSTSWNSNDRLFVLGKGLTPYNRKDALTVMKNGNTTISGTLTLTDEIDEITFPNFDGANNQILKTDGAGNLSWQSDAVNDADASNTNELQTLSLSGNSLSISSGNNVSLSGVGGQWSETGSDIYFTGGSVGIGTSTPPSERLLVTQTGNEDAIRIYNSYSGSSNKRGLFMDISSGGSGTKTGAFAQVVAGSSTNTIGLGSYIIAGASGNHRAIYGSVTGTGKALEGIALDATGIALRAQGPSHLEGDVAIGTDELQGKLHVHDPDNSLAEIYVTPNATSSGGSSSITLGEDADATFAMSLNYNGADNNLEVFGHSALGGTPVVFGPHLLISRDDGDVSIGGDFAAGHKLSVDGKVACEEVLVELSDSWPDYVFEEDYDLRSIEELERYISAESHLPGIAPAKLIESEGLPLGEMQRLLTEKIEELTLYIIQLNNTNKKLQKRIEALEAPK